MNSYVYVCVSVMFPVFFGDAESFSKVLWDQRMCKVEKNPKLLVGKILHTRKRMYVSQIAHTHTDHFDTHTHVLSADVHICNVKRLRIRSLPCISARVDFSLQCV